MRHQGTIDDYFKVVGIKKTGSTDPKTSGVKPSPGGASAPGAKPAAGSAPSSAAAPVPGEVENQVETTSRLTPSTLREPSKRVRKSRRPEKPAALKPEAVINVGCTLKRRDAIKAAAESLGLSMTAYLLYCEEQSVHELVKYLIAYIETRSQIGQEEVQARMAQLEELVKQGLSPR